MIAYPTVEEVLNLNPKKCDIGLCLWLPYKLDKAQETSNFAHFNCFSTDPFVSATDLVYARDNKALEYIYCGGNIVSERGIVSAVFPSRILKEEELELFTLLGVTLNKEALLPYKYANTNRRRISYDLLTVRRVMSARSLDENTIKVYLLDTLNAMLEYEMTVYATRTTKVLTRDIRQVFAELALNCNILNIDIDKSLLGSIASLSDEELEDELPRIKYVIKIMDNEITKQIETI